MKTFDIYHKNGTYLGEYEALSIDSALEKMAEREFGFLSYSALMIEFPGEYGKSQLEVFQLSDES